MKLRKTLLSLALCALLLAGCGLPGTTAAPADTTLPEFSAPEADGVKTVTTADEFLAAIAPNTEILVDTDLLDLSTATDYGTGRGTYYYWVEAYDGPELFIYGVDGLTIRGASGDREAHVISAAPRYANVLNFDSCANIRISSLTAGHTEAPGQCAGGVLNFIHSQDILVEDCGLFGCGTFGVRGNESSNMRILGNDIYECTLGGLELFSCRDVQVDGNTFRDLGGSVYFLYDCENVTQDGAPVEEEEPIYEDPAPEEPDPEPFAATLRPVISTEQTAVTVTTADEFLAAIAPDTLILLDTDLLDLTTATGYGTGKGEYYYWSESFDGPELYITDVSNLTIRGVSGDRTAHVISAAPRYANVLNFKNCGNILLVGFTAGHTEEPGYCAGGVLSFENCEAVLITDCGLFGCGTLGVKAYWSMDIQIVENDIYECSVGGVEFTNCRDINVDGNTFRDLGGPVFRIYDCQNITCNGEEAVPFQ